MSLLEKLPELRELAKVARIRESKANMPHEAYYEMLEAQDVLLEGAFPEMLEALSCFKPGDLQMLLKIQRDFYPDNAIMAPENYAARDVLKRLQKAAEILEAP